MKNMDDRIQRVYDFLLSYTAENGYAPSVREICASCNLKSTATAYHYLNRLHEKGLISKTDNKKRAVSLKQQTVNVPLIGTVAAGQPIFAMENYEDVYNLPSNFFGAGEMFMLTVKGDSMINIGILNGDKIVVRRQDTADNGEIVVALVDDSATVKRFYKRDGKFVLHPENDYMEDMIFDDVSILGKVIGLLRNI
ncbi:MAG: transcriptional repressor LexA [Clostridia bacterium]|nr:transcriptional repressor LexA [Clostridia bacterium]